MMMSKLFQLFIKTDYFEYVLPGKAQRKGSLRSQLTTTMCSKSVSSPEFRIICEEEGRVFDGEMIQGTFQNQFGSDQRQICIIFAYK